MCIRDRASAKWTWFAIGYQTVLAYAVALMINQIGGLLTGGLTFGVGTLAALIVLVAVYKRQVLISIERRSTGQVVQTYEFYSNGNSRS